MKEIDLDSIIEYFKNELNLLSDNYKQSGEDRRFILTVSVMIFSVFSVLTSAFVQAIIQLGQFELIRILLMLLILPILAILVTYAYIDNKRSDSYYKQRVSLEIILKFLLNFKTMKKDNKDLLPLFEKIKTDFRDARIYSIDSRKDFEKLCYDRLTEYVIILNKIDSDLIKKGE